MTPFHFTIDKKAREGVYHLRVYSLPITTAVQMMDHWTWLEANTTPTPLPSSIVTTMPDFEVESENEIEQGVPRFSEAKFEFEPVKELIPLMQAVRDSDMEIWVEVVLEQHVLDAPDLSAKSSIVWPMKKRNVFWGLLDRKSVKGKIIAQQWDTSHPVVENDYLRKTKTHDGSLELSAIHWIKCLKTTPKSFLDSIKPLSSFRGTAVGDLLVSIVQAIAPTGISVTLADHTLVPQNPVDLFINRGKQFGKMPFELSSDGTTWWDNIFDFNITWGTLGLWFDGAAQIPPIATPDTSLYHWQDLAQALAETCREVFYDFQIELPTMEAHAAAKPFDPAGMTRFFFRPQTEAPLPIYLDPDEDSIEYTPCGAWAYKYTVEEPTADGLFPDPPSATGISKFLGGEDQSYKTLFRFVGQSFVNNVLTDDARGWELQVKNGSGVLHNAKHVHDKVTDLRQTDWASFHAFFKINRWGAPRALVTLTARGVGIEPFGATATADGKAIKRPSKTFGLPDWGDFALGRYIDMNPGILSSPGDTQLEHLGIVDARRFIVIGIKRVPDADMEVKLLEFEPVQYYGAGDVLIAHVPPTTTNPHDPPTTSIPNEPTLAAGPLTGTQTIELQALNTSGVAQVKVLIDGVLLDTQVGPRADPVWTVTWDTTLIANGTHTVKVIAYDGSGNIGSHTITVTVAN